MRRIFLCVMIGLLLPAALSAQTKQNELKITLKNNAQDEAQTRTQLQRLLTEYDLTRFIFTREIVIDRQAIPHSHPVLTLSTRHLKDDELLLSTFVHEQFHWFLSQREEQTEKAKKELRTIFPNAPAGGPEGARDEESTYLHLLVNTLEYAGIRELLGELRARQVMEFWATDHYRWIYRQVLSEGRKIREVLVKHKLTL
ncbi:MAG TPA: hypothetical protein VJS44_08850 [Pyrinomonadaceae bacterium]|nr:hypothetical protein [Pyrinomonadaceae bacterium]